MFRAVVAGAQVKDSMIESWRSQIASLNEPWAEEQVQVNFLGVSQIGGGSEIQVKRSVAELVKAQSEDEDIPRVIDIIKSGSYADFNQADSKELHKLKLEIKRMTIDDRGVLVRKNGDKSQIILPKTMRGMIYKHLHVDMGHLGVERVAELA